MLFRCQSCGFSKEVSRKYAGQKVKCPECRESSRMDLLPHGDSETPEHNSGSLTISDSTTLDNFVPEAVQLSDSNSDSIAEPVADLVAELVADTDFQLVSEQEEDAPETNRVLSDTVRGAQPHAISPATRPKTQPNPLTTQMLRVVNYKVHRGKLGSSLSYPCPACGTKLNSSLHEAGARDHCPACHVVFIVPGEKEAELEAKQKADSLAVRKAAQEDRMEASKAAVVNRVAQNDLKNQSVQLDYDPLREWLIYVAIMGLFLAVVAGKYLVSAVVHDSSYLCIVIFALFCMGLLINFRGILRLRNEYVCAAVCMINMKKMNGLKTVAQGPAAGILHQHVMDLSKISRYDVNLSQDSLVTLLYSRMMAKSKIVDVLSGVLVTLGLIGTIVGLISMTDGLSDTLASLGDEGAAGELLGGMRATMSGLGTAFNTTLVGAILGSVVLRILNNVYTSNVDHLITYVASTAEISIVPQLKQLARTGETV